MRAAVVLLAAIALGACGTRDRTMSPACTADTATIARALDRAPAPVRLPDGTLLSQCMAAADTDAALQSFGVLATQVADDLADRGAALRLGYLIGAARRGATRTNGIGAELEHRLESSARRLSGSFRGQLERGLRAGEQTG